MKPILVEADFDEIERRYPEGLTSQDVVRFFSDRGIRLSEATFRKYVQLGLLPRSRRVGRKGRHKGSTGLYPARILRRIWRVRRLMEEGYTIDEIAQGVMRFRGRLDDLDWSLSEVFGQFESELSRVELDEGRRRAASAELREARRAADRLLERLERLEQIVVEGGPESAAEEEMSGRRVGRRFF